MILTYLHRDIMFQYHQRPRHRLLQLLGFKYGRGWYITVLDKWGNTQRSELRLISPSPELVMAETLKLYDEIS